MEYKTVRVKLPKLRTKQSKTWRSILLFLSKLPVWTPKDYLKLSKAGYQGNPAVYRCVTEIASTVAGSLYWKLNKIPKGESGEKEELKNHALLKVLKRPNPKESKYKFIEKVIAYLLLAGNTYLERVGPTRGAPKELYCPRPDRMRVIPGTTLELVGGYTYDSGKGDPTPFKPEEILHLKLFNPTDDWYGMSPLEAAAKGVDISNMLMSWNYKLLENDCRPPGGLSTESNLTDAQFERVKKDLKEKYQGYENAGEPLLLEGGLKWQSFSIPPKDADWLGLDKATDKKICMVYNIAPELIGDSDNKTYSNYQEARKALYMEVALPLMEMLKDEFNYWLVPAFVDPEANYTLELDFDKDKIEAIQEDRNKAYERTAKAWWLSVNEKREATGFESWGTVGDVILVPIGLVPLGVSSVDDDSDSDKGTGSQIITKSSEVNNKGFWQKLERKEALWRNFVSRVKAKERPFVDQVAKYLKAQSKTVKGNLEGLISLSQILPEGLLDLDKEIGKYQEKFLPWYSFTFTTALEAGLEASKGSLYELDMKQGRDLINMDPELMAKLTEMIVFSGTKINEFTMTLIMDTLRIAEFDNWTVEEFTQEILNKFNQFNAFRSRRIARTEAMKVENYGQHEGYKESQFIQSRGWLSAFTPKTREDHKIADQKYSDNPISLNEPFDVGGELMMFPGDSSLGASASNIINCLCSTYPDVQESLKE
jgi:HK97 family phage portal protein